MTKVRKPVVVMMGGGTGGHVFPGLAVAEHLREQQVEVVWWGTRKGLESQIVPEAGFKLQILPAAGVRGKKLKIVVKACFTLLLAFFKALRMLLKQRPDVVVGMGGYVAVPGGLAAVLCRIPLLIHEQNVVPGLANRVLAPFSRAVLTGFPSRLLGASARWVGTPVRREILRPAACRKPSQNSAAPLRVLVIGGSQGAEVFNRLVPETVAYIAAEHRPRVLVQTGVAEQEKVRKRARELNVKLKPVAFIKDMVAVYAWADVLLCRAGASTIAEICAVGIASVLIPHPYVVDDHQTENARYLASRGAAVLLPQEHLSVADLAEILQLFHFDRERLARTAAQARALACPRAAVETSEAVRRLFRP